MSSLLIAGFTTSVAPPDVNTIRTRPSFFVRESLTIEDTLLEAAMVVPSVIEFHDVLEIVSYILEIVLGGIEQQLCPAWDLQICYEKNEVFVVIHTSMIFQDGWDRAGDKTRRYFSIWIICLCLKTKVMHDKGKRREGKLLSRHCLADKKTSFATDKRKERSLSRESLAKQSSRKGDSNQYLIFIAAHQNILERRC
jgi:hypothetical protein